MNRKLHYSEPKSVAIYSYFSAISYFAPLLGGYLADSYLGKYKVQAVIVVLAAFISYMPSQTILYFLLVYLCGITLLAVVAVNPTPVPVFGALFLIALGTGGTLC